VGVALGGPSHWLFHTSDFLEREVSILGDDLDALGMCLAAVGELTKRDRLQQMLPLRRYLLTLLEFLAMLVKFSHNRMVLLTSGGPAFANLLMSLLLALCRSLDQVVQGWSDAATPPTGGGDSIPRPHRPELLEETRFVVACLFQCNQVLCYTVPVFGHFCFLVEDRSLLPRHPWSSPHVARLCATDPHATAKSLYPGEGHDRSTSCEPFDHPTRYRPAELP
jgi:hypothetical protein